MSETTDKPRETWKQHDILALAHHYANGGIEAAKAAYPTRDVPAKLAALGLLKLSAADEQAIRDLVAAADKSHVRALFVKRAIGALRPRGPAVGDDA
jgi:hypothetical protein